MEVTSYDIENKREYEEELCKLYDERENIERLDEETVCRAYNADSKDEILQITEEEIRYYEEKLEAIEEWEEEEEDAERTGVDPGFANMADYIRYKYG